MGLDEHVFHQTPYRVRFEWGAEGVRRLAPLSGVVVVVDVCSFTTCVDIAVSRGAIVFPFRGKGESALGFARSVNALLAGKRGETPSLSPHSLLALPQHSRIVLPSLNGSVCSAIAHEAGAVTVAGCLRNAIAVSDYINTRYADDTISVVACGEQWANGELRPAIEDWIAAGAILHSFDPAQLSPEAGIAVGAFRAAERDLQAIIEACTSGRELAAKGFGEDVRLASEWNVSKAVPVLHDGAYRNLA